jgi:hypothetical protein
VERYKNLGGDSNVVAYEIGREEITVQFGDGAIYLYDSQHTSPQNIVEMQRLALRGQGLNSFIGRVVKKGYAKKIR